jgi:hypothetical protein
MYYKIVRDDRGRLVHYRKMFEEYRHAAFVPHATVQNNTANEIADAVTQFLRDVRHPWREPDEAEMTMFPLDTWIRHAGARLSPAWLRQFTGSSIHVSLARE